MPASEALPHEIPVLRIVARLGVSGPSIQIVELTRRLRDYGYGTTLLRGQPEAREGSMDYLAERIGVEPITVPGLRRTIGLHDLWALWNVVGWMRRVRPAVLHTHTAKAGTVGRVAAMITPGARPGVIVHTFHGHVLKGEFGPGVSRAVAFVERWLARRTTRLIAVSEEIKQDLVDFRVAEPEKIEVIRLGFDLSAFARDGDERAARGAATRRRLGIPEEALVVTLSCRIVKVKRVDRFLQAARELAERENVWFVIAGDGSMRPELERSEDSRALGERLIWAGFDRDMPGICFASDVVTLTSDNEGTPAVLIEAQAAGVPVVATRVGGMETAILDGRTGSIAEPDAKSLAVAIGRLLDEPETRREWGRNGREHALSNFSIERLVDDIQELYGRLLGPDAPASQKQGSRTVAEPRA